MKKRGVVLVISGPSGAGKDTISDIIMSQSNFSRFPTYTTRERRQGETDGVHYHFVKKEEFEILWQNGEFLDRAGVHDYYGLPIKKLNEALEIGQNLIVHLIAKSALELKRINPDAMLVFILPPSLEESMERMRKRGMTEEQTVRRLENDTTTLDVIGLYDLVITNHNNKEEEVAEQILSFLSENKAVNF